MALHNESIRKEVLELFLEQVCDIVNCTPYMTDSESIHLSPSSFLGFKKAPDLLWTREVKSSGKIGRALNSVLLKLKNWHLCNIKQRADQIQSSTAKFLIVKQSTKKSTHVPPCVEDIVCLSTNNNERHIGQILEIKRQTARVLCQDRVYSQPISFLSPLYTEQDEGKQLNPLVGIDNAPGMTLTDVFKNDELEDSELAHTQPDTTQTNGVAAPI